MYRPIAILFTLAIAVSPAQARQVSAADLQRAAHFCDRMQKVYEKGKDLNRKMDGARDYIAAFRDGEMEAAEFMDELDPFLEGMRSAVDGYRARYPRAPLPPSIGSKPYEKILAHFAKTVVDLGGLLDRQLGLLNRMRDAALRGDEISYEDAIANLLVVSRQMIKAENTALNASLVTMERRDPRYGLINAEIGGNKASAAALQVLEAGLRGADFDAGSLALAVETGLRDAARGIVDGEKATDQMLKDLEGKFAKTDADRRWAVHVGTMAEAYRRAFAVERGILETERRLLDYLRAVNAGDDNPDAAQGVIADFQYELQEQIRQRAAERDRRRQMNETYKRDTVLSQ